MNCEVEIVKSSCTAVLFRLKKFDHPFPVILQKLGVVFIVIMIKI
jgi:hypothetical protein